jgi:hypothetical protein
MRANLKPVKPAMPVNGTVPPKRVCNAEVRPREYLTPKEVERLIKASRARGRTPHSSAPVLAEPRRAHGRAALGHEHEP